MHFLNIEIITSEFLSLSHLKTVFPSVQLGKWPELPVGLEHGIVQSIPVLDLLDRG